MAWRNEETEEGQDIVYDGVEFGIAPSPTKGTANIQNANISTESGEVLASYGRTAQQQAAITNGTLTPDGATLFDAPANLKAGTWISVSASTVTSISTTTTPTTVAIDYLIVGGGGGGGNADNISAAGGGGAGEYISSSGTIGVGNYAITIGAGGAGGSTFSDAGDNGGNTVFTTIDTAVGGGGGGYSLNTGGTLNGANGASGGGGGGGDTGNAGTGGTASAGNAGGAGFDSATSGNRAGGGGGGSGGAGSAGASAVGGNGGAGTSNSITGTAVIYAAGGGGGSLGTPGTGGSSGAGGAGGDDAAGSAATTPGSGGGGGSTSSTTDADGGDGADGIVVVKYLTGAMVATGGSISRIGAYTIHTFTTDDVFRVIAIAQTNLYYVSYNSNGKVKLSAKYDPYEENELTHGTTGSITFSTVAVPGAAIAKATEKYGTATNTEYRYYVLDNNSRTWVYDTGVYDTNGTLWMLPDPINYSSLAFTGIGVLNGCLFNINVSQLYFKTTSNLGFNFTPVSNGKLSNPFPTHINYVLTGNQGKMYYTDLNYIGELFPTTSLLTSLANIQSYGSYTASTTTGTISALTGGSLPYTLNASNAVARIPASFYTDVYGTQPTNLNQGTVYWIEYDINASTFEVYAASTGGSAIDIAAGAAGKQYYSTFYPLGDMGINGADSTVQFTQQRVNLPANEVAQCLVEVGNTVIIGGKGNLLYPWNQIDATPSDFIALPESDTKVMINVNNMVYVFAGYKGNIYITNGSVASLGLKVPDYCAGVPGTPLTYIEPYFTWFDAMYLRGRVYFSILDQTATKAGNCGGVWSFVPSQNMAQSDIGNALRLENQNSYGDYDGAARILIPNEEQLAVSPQYWSFWQDSYSTGTSSFGIDTTAATPVTTYVLETDLIPTGTLLSKDTYTQLEYKLSTALQSGDSVQLYYRLDSTSAWTSCGTANIETAFPISGYYEMAFQKTQWLQFRAVVTTSGTTASSFGRLAQIILR